MASLSVIFFKPYGDSAYLGAKSRANLELMIFLILKETLCKAKVIKHNIGTESHIK